MTPERFEEIRRLFDQASELAAAEQETFLTARCGPDDELRHHVERLLHRNRSLNAAIDAPAIDHRVLHAVATPLPERIGRFRVLSLLGQGGMGSVYEAAQENPSRNVAVKVIRADAVSEEAMRRFAHEAQILGRLQHPGIACIYEGGVAATESGPRPYMAMELVRGPSLAAYAAQHAPDVRGRLELFARVCDAAEHAHQAGIVHRDLKPSNILIDHSGQPKIVDFGVARAIDAARAGATMHTEAGRVIGTLTYMSPEQITGQNAVIDARSDVYSLGVMLFELLARRLPYDLRDHSLPEAARMLREDEPSRLSSISAEFRGDLETITAKALEKDPQRRYASAGELAADLRRHLRDQPVHARPASTGYQLRKFARRHKELVAGVGAAFVVLVAGLAAVSMLAVRESRQRQLSQRNEARARWESYRNCIAAADRALRLHDTAGALALLESAPADLRGWEWRYLRAKSDQSLLTIPAHRGPVTAAVLRMGGAIIVSAGADGTIRRWNTNDGAPLSNSPAHSGGVLALAGSPDDRLLVSSGNDNTIAGWDATTGAELWRQPASGQLHPQAFFPDASAIAVPLESRIGYLEPGTGREIGSLKLPLTAARLPAIDQSGTTLMCEIGGVVVAFDITTSAELWRAPADAFAFAAEKGRAWLYSDFTNVITIADARTGVTIGSIRDAHGLVAGAPGGLMATRQGPVDILLRLPSGEPTAVALRGHTSTPTAIAFGPSDARVVSGDQRGELKLWSSRSSGAVLPIPASNDALIAGAMQPGGARVATAGWGGVKFWDLATGDELQTSFPLNRDIHAIGFAPDGRRLAVAGYDGVVAIIDSDAAPGTVLGSTSPAGTGITSLAWAGNGAQIFAAGFDGTLRRFNTADASFAGSLALGSIPLAAVVTSGANGQFAVINDQGVLWLCPETLRDGTPGPELEIEAGTRHPAQPGAVHSLAFNSTGDRLAVGASSGAVVLIDVETRRVLWSTPAAGPGGVSTLAFSPDGSRVFAGHIDASVHVLDVATGDDMLRLTVSRTPICGIGCTADQLVVISRHPLGRCDVIGPPPTLEQIELRERHARIRGIVDDRFKTQLLLPDVVASLKSDVAMTEQDRAAAIALAEARGDHPSYLNSEAWGVVRFPGRSAAEYQLALRKALRACELRPRNHSFLNTLGIAQFRAGDLSAAVATLTTCIEIQRERQERPHPLDSLVLAMVHDRLGRPEEARASLAAAREAMDDDRYRADTEVLWFLAEAEKAITTTP